MDVGILILLLIILSPSSSTGDNASNQSWNRTYETKHTRDVETSMIPDKGNGFLYLCGQAFGPRLRDASFAGMIYSNAMDAANSPLPSLEQNFTDGTMTKLDISNGKVLYSYRETKGSSDPHVYTMFTAMKLSPSTKYVFVVGNKRRYNTVTSSGVTTVKDWTFIRMFNAHLNEKPFADYEILTEDQALSSTPVVDATEDALILCSTIIPIKGKSFSVITKVTRLLFTESPSWISWRIRLDGALCTALTIGSGGERIFVGGGLEGGAGVWHLSAKTGYVFWSRKLITSSRTTTVSAPVAIGERNGCVYASVKLTSATNAETAAIFKLSTNYGTIVWYSVTCCEQLNTSHTIAMPHILLIQDSVKHVVRTNESLLVAQVTTHGKVEPLTAVPGLTPNEVQLTREVTLHMEKNVYEVIVLSMARQSERAYTKILRVILEQPGGRTGSMEITGGDFVEEVRLTAVVRLSVRVDVMHGAGTTLGAVCDMTAEAVEGDMGSAMVSGKDGVSGDQEGYGEFVMNVRGNDVATVVVRIHKVLREIFEKQGIDRSKIEARLNVSENCVMLLNFSVQGMTQNGIGQQREAHGQVEEMLQEDLKGAAQNGVTTMWMAIGFVAVGVATVAIVIVAVLTAQGLVETEIHDVEGGFNGRAVRGSNDPYRETH